MEPNALKYLSVLNTAVFCPSHINVFSQACFMNNECKASNEPCAQVCELEHYIHETHTGLSILFWNIGIDSQIAKKREMLTELKDMDNTMRDLCESIVTTDLSVIPPVTIEDLNKHYWPGLEETLQVYISYIWQKNLNQYPETEGFVYEQFENCMSKMLCYFDMLLALEESPLHCGVYNLPEYTNMPEITSEAFVSIVRDTHMTRSLIQSYLDTKCCIPDCMGAMLKRLCIVFQGMIEFSNRFNGDITNEDYFKLTSCYDRYDLEAFRFEEDSNG